MEFATKLAGTKVVVILGHTACGAVKGACDHATLGNLTGMLDKIAPAVTAVTEPADASMRTSGNIDFVNQGSQLKMCTMAIDNLRAMSPVLSEMEAYWSDQSSRGYVPYRKWAGYVFITRTCF